jgi:catechol 2,3-dioxygenase-like lactoylglutathione lyase family enzyme
MGIGQSRVGHVAIHVTDMDRSIEFYRRVVGLKVTGLWGEPYRKSRQCFMRIDAMHHDVVLFEMPKEVDRSRIDTSDSARRRIGGLHHIAFEFPEREDWLHALDHVKACGIEIVSGPYVHAYEAGEEGGFPGGSGSHAFYFCDPDGNRIEFYCWMMRISKPSLAAPTPDL